MRSAISKRGGKEPGDDIVEAVKLLMTESLGRTRPIEKACVNCGLKLAVHVATDSHATMGDLSFTCPACKTEQTGNLPAPVIGVAVIQVKNEENARGPIK
jgi:hypothetical protein